MKRLLISILFLLLCDVPAWGAVAYDTFSQSACTGCSSDSWSHTTTGANTFLICGGGYNDVFGGTTTIDTFTINSLPLALEATDNSDSIFFAVMYRRTAPTAGAQTVAITYNQVTNHALGCMTFTGVDQSSPTGTSATNNGTSGGLSASITVPASGMGASFATVGAGGVSCENNSTSQDEKFELCNDDFTVAGMGATTASTGSVAMDWTFYGVHYSAMVAVPIHQAAAGAATSRRTIVVQ